MPGLLDLLGLGGIGAGLPGISGNDPEQTAQPLPPLAGDPASVNPQQMMDAQIAKTSDAVVPAFQSHKLSFLAALADSYLAGHGRKPVFSQMNDQKNMMAAMQNFATDPLSAIKNVAAIPGHQADAWKMYQSYEDDKRADVQSEMLNEQRKDQARGRLASYFGAIQNSKDPEATYTKLLPNLRKYATSRGLDPTEIPDKYDPDLATMYQYGGISADAQLDNARDEDYKSRRLGQMDRTIQDREQYQNSRLGQMNQTLDERRRHNQAIENKPAASRTKPSVSYVNTKYGPGEVSPDGKALKVNINRQDHIYTRVGDGQWRHVKVLPSNPKAGTLSYSDVAADDDDEN
jgi:hypothetical protein